MKSRNKRKNDKDTSKTYVQTIQEPVMVMKDAYAYTHKAVKHLLSTDEKTGAQVFAKEGKAIQTSERKVWEKNELRKGKIKTIVHKRPL